MSAIDTKSLLALAKRKEQLADAKKAFMGGHEIQGILSPEDFQEVRHVANLAVENKLNDLLEQASRAFDGAWVGS